MTKPGAEERVAEQLVHKLGLEIYFPRIEVRIKKGRQMVSTLRPLFPNYIFARFLLPDQWKLISYTRGVNRILGSWSQPSWVNEEVISAIKERECQPDRVIKYYNFQPEDRVYIKHGPLKDLYGIFERYVDDHGRVKVLLSLIGYQASADMDASLLEKI